MSIGHLDGQSEGIWFMVRFQILKGFGHFYNFSLIIFSLRSVLETYSYCIPPLVIRLLAIRVSDVRLMSTYTPSSVIILCSLRSNVRMLAAQSESLIHCSLLNPVSLSSAIISATCHTPPLCFFMASSLF